jgi:2,3-bisphosphoglycerate-independent phosphoglycerate mutase
MPHPPKPCLLIILDGWGYRENPENNAIFRAKKPTWDRLWQQYPHTLIRASEAAVGLPSRQMGNSEVGHMNLGAGRVVYQEYTRINRAISSGAFFTNKTLTDAVDLAKDTTRAVHILGLLSPGGVHSHESHIQATAQLAVERGNKKVYLHAFLDGRDTLPKSAASSITAMEAKFNELGCGRFASIIGRHYAMDRDHRWPRVQEAYDLLTIGKANYSATSATEALQMAYDRDESDEFVQATSIVPEGSQSVQIRDGDIVIFMNFRSDRARQITRPFIEPDFDDFTRQVWPKLGRFVSLTEYNSEFDVPVAFPAERLKNVFGDYLSQLGKRQLRIAETEKYAHVTFFFNGGVETPFEGEERILIPSPTDVSTYNLKPEMNAELVTDEVCKAITEGDFDTIICNFANPDMVGHTGDFDATVQAIEAIDRCLARILTALEKVDSEMLITSDHGNAELMKDPESSQAHTAHTTNPVPLIYVGRRATIDSSGSLEDVIPTLLHMMGLAIPTEMKGQSLLEFQDEVANT